MSDILSSLLYRSTTLILAYLIRYENMSLLQAHELVLSQRTFIRPNIGFWKQLVAYEYEISGSNSVTIMTVQGGKGKHLNFVTLIK